MGFCFCRSAVHARVATPCSIYVSVRRVLPVTWSVSSFRYACLKHSHPGRWVSRLQVDGTSKGLPPTKFERRMWKICHYSKQKYVSFFYLYFFITLHYITQQEKHSKLKTIQILRTIRYEISWVKTVHCKYSLEFIS